MEGEKRAGSSSTTSFTSDLFDSKASSASSGIFGSIFSSNSPNMVLGRECLHSQSVEKKHYSATHVWNTKPRHPDSSNQNKQTEGDRSWEDDDPYYAQQNVQPFNLSSSIYYGGQDVYSSPRTRQRQEYSTLNKDEGDDDSGSASRGNWWKGGLYY